MTRRDRDRIVADLTEERDAAVARAEKAEADAARLRREAFTRALQSAHGRAVEVAKHAADAVSAEARAVAAMTRVADLEAEVAGLRARVVEAMAPHLRHMVEGGAVNGGDMLRDVCEATGVDYGDIRRAAEVDP